MFKWCCLAVAVVAVLIVGWMVNDVRLQASRATKTVNENLPEILEKSKQASQAVSDNLPAILEKSKKTTETLAELSEDVRQLRDLAGLTNRPRDEGLVRYADSVLDTIEAAGGTIGLKKKLLGSGLKDTMPTKEWVVGARKEALLLTVTARSRGEMLERLAKNKFGSDWHLQVDGAEPVPLAGWLRANHPESKDLK